ncbi:MAG: aminopeptidase [Bacteroidota bacterium]
MIKKIKIILLVLLLAIAGYVILHLSDVIYGIAQLKGQLHLVMNTRPVTEVIDDANVSAEIKTKLKLIQVIRKYASDSLGLKESKNYTTFYDQQNKPVLWVLTACSPFELKPYQWEFPFLGKVPYKGFFVEEKGKAEQQKLKLEMLDTELGATGGWSTLGWFTDPVLSNMLKRSDGKLAELIIHELTHATVYIAGNTEYNENLATFIGEKGAEKFLADHYGTESEELKSYIYYKEDEEIYGNYMLQSSNALDSLYKTFQKEPLEDKLRKKYLFILKIVQDIKHLPLHNKSRYQFKFPGDHLPNNAWFMGYRRYRGNQSGLQEAFEAQHSDLKLFVHSLLKK